MATPVSESTGYGANRQMSFLGYLLVFITAIVLLPLLPFIIVGWLLWKLLASDDDEPPRRSWKRKGGKEPRGA